MRPASGAFACCDQSGVVAPKVRKRICKPNAGPPPHVGGYSQEVRSDGGEVKQLGAMSIHVQIQPLVLQIVAKTLVLLMAEQVLHQPVAPGQPIDGQRHKTLAAMWSQVHDQEIKAIRL